MKRQKAQRSTISIFDKAVVTATLLGCAAVPQGVQAAQAPDVVTSGVYVSILSPTVDAADPNKPIEISADYQATAVTGGISSLELYIDGQQKAVKTLDVPENRGRVTFLINPGTLTPGDHHIVVRVSATDAEVASAQTGVNVPQPVIADLTPAPALGGDTDTGSAPAVAIMTPDANATVTGIVDIKVDAHDNSGKSPYVSLFVDHTFKTLRNFPPYDFAWDTTRVANGYHTIEVWGYNDDQAVGHATPLTVFVNNPGGRTLVRHDLLDTVPTKVLLDASKTNSSKAKSIAQAKTGGANHAQKLASTQNAERRTSISESTLLMEPFISDTAPTMQREAAAPIHMAPTLASRTASASSNASDQLSPVSNVTTDLSNAILLAEPTIETLTTDTPVAPRAKTNSTATLAMTSNVAVNQGSVQLSETSDIAGPINLSPTDIAPTVSLPTVDGLSNIAPAQPQSAAVVPHASQTPRLDDAVETPAYPTTLDPAPLVSLSGKQSASLEEPTIEAAPVSLKAAMAEGAVAQVPNVPTRLASVSIDSAPSFTSTDTLQAPQISVRRVLNFVSSHRVGTRLEPLGSSPAGFAPDTVRRFQLVMNSRLVALDQPLADKDNFLFAPFRQIFENEGGVMSWNSALKQVHAMSSTRDVTVTIGSTSATVNQQSVTLTTKPYIIKGHTMIPLAFVPMALDATVNFDPATGHLVINSNN